MWPRSLPEVYSKFPYVLSPSFRRRIFDSHHTQNGEVSEILQAKLADGHSVGYICAVGDRWCSLCETRAPAFSPKVMLFDRVVLPVLNHVDFQASELGGLDKSNQFYGC